MWVTGEDEGGGGVGKHSFSGPERGADRGRPFDATRLCEGASRKFLVFRDFFLCG
jgi:hypothetical protein